MILAALSGYYENLKKKGLVSGIGYATAPISYALVIKENGLLVDVEDVRDVSAKNPRPRSFLVPQQGTRTSGIAPNIFWDKTSYVLGVSLSSKRFEQEHKAFTSFHNALLKDNEDLGLKAFLAFINDWDYQSFNDNKLLQPIAESFIDSN